MPRTIYPVLRNRRSIVLTLAFIALTSWLALPGSSNRLLPTAFAETTFTVTNAADAGPGSLRQAILDANAVTGGSVINFNISAGDPGCTGGVCTITLLSGELLITRDVTMSWTGPQNLIVRRNPSGTTDFRIFHITSGSTVKLTRLTITQGKAPSGSSGGGILTDHSALTLTDCTVTGNESPVSGGGIYSDGSNSGAATLTLINSTVSGNKASSFGGGVLSEGFQGNATLNILNSTISGNSASFAGGIYSGGNNGIAAVNITNSTISGNSAAFFGGGIDNVGNSGMGTLTLNNTIVANNTANDGPDIFNSFGTVNGSNNLIETTADYSFNSGSNNMTGVDPQLGPLASNGGPTQTHALLTGSPARDAGDNTLASSVGLTTDQRGAGFSRVADGNADGTATVDIGSYEAHAAVADIADRSTSEDTPLSFSFNVGDAGSITSVVATSSNTTLVPNDAAHLSLTGSGSSRTLTITPAADLSGTSTMTVTVNSGTESATDTFLLTVNPVNDPPAANAQSVTTNVDTAVQIILTGSDKETPAGSLIFTVTAQPAHGTLTGTGPNLTYTPSANYTGPDSFKFTVTDTGDGSSAPLTTPEATVSITVIGQTIRFDAAAYTVGEAAGRATITVTRTGSTAQTASVAYTTSDAAGLNNCNVNTGDASARCDYTAVGGTLNFAAGQASLTFTVPIINDVYVEGPEVLTLTLSGPVGSPLGTPSTATLTITDNDDTQGAANPIDQREFFIRQLYLDTLNREPDPPGLAAWLDRLNTCPRPGETIQNCDETEVASAFFRSPEFFDRSFFLYKFYEASLVRQPQYDEYQHDLLRMTGFLTTEELELRKQQFVEEFVNRPEFHSLYDSFANGQPFVDAVLARAGSARPGVGAAVVVTSNRQSVINRLGAGQITRAQALRELMEAPEMSQRFFNKAFVVVGYFAFLRRNPDAAYLTWINVLNTTGDYREMIRGFSQSPEYRFRFGQ